MTFYIGTCRYMDSELWDSMFPARLHSTKEIIHFLENINNIEQIIQKYSSNIINVIFGDIMHPFVQPLVRVFLEQKDFKKYTNINIEITSRKVYMYGSVPINWWYSSAILKKIKENTTTAPSKDDLLFLKFIEKCEYRELTNEEIKKDLEYINKLIKLKFNENAVLNIIAQLNLKLKETNDYIPDRNSLVRGIIDSSLELGINCYNTGGFIEENYDEKFMQDYAQDSQHFNSILVYDRVTKMFLHKRPINRVENRKELNKVQLV